MNVRLTDIVASADAEVRDCALERWCAGRSAAELLAACAELDEYRRGEANLYHRVRALFFLSAIHRYHLPALPGYARGGRVPFAGHHFLLERRFEEAISLFQRELTTQGANDTISSALAAAYYALAFQTLADQVRRTVRSTRGNAWMFRLGHPLDQPLRVRSELLARAGSDTPHPVLRELTAVRMDLTHCGWSDIFFLGMDFPEGARVLNISVDLGVHGRDAAPRPPVEAYFRVIDEPVIRLTSVDLGASAVLTQIDDVFDFARDYLGLLKAAVIAAGLVPPGIERSGTSLSALLAGIFGPGRGFELVSNVNRIPKGSRLAVSTNLLGALIGACMRATGQIASLDGPMEESERRIVAARAILGEWIGGSGGGWQDSGGLWPGIKLIEGGIAGPGDPEFGFSRGCLLPRHTLLGLDRISAAARTALQDSLVLVHGGMAQNVGPILEMATEKYLLRSEAEWLARRQAVATLDEILGLLARGDVRGLGRALTANFTGPLQTMIPWVSNLYTERLIAGTREKFGDDFWGFWMLGGMSGGGMGFIFAPARKREGQVFLQQLMLDTKRELETALPFAMDPVVYDFAINEQGSVGALLQGDAALLPAGFYQAALPDCLRRNPDELTPRERLDVRQFTHAARTQAHFAPILAQLLDRPAVATKTGADSTGRLRQLLNENGFDEAQHEQIRADLRAGRIGLALNRLPAATRIEDVAPGDLTDAARLAPALRAAGEEALRRGEVAIVSYAAGVGSRWTQGAGVVKGLHPFAKFAGRHRSFIEVHLAKTRRASRAAGTVVPHVFTTSHLTHAPIERLLQGLAGDALGRDVWLSPGRSIGLRLVPSLRDLQFAWEETAQQRLDEQRQKMRASVRAALANWARTTGEATDYTDNLPEQCLHPVGHWFELPNFIKNGGLARLRLVEGMSLPREEDEFALSYYNSNTCWIDLDRLLALFELRRTDLADPQRTADAVRAVAARVPTYVTLKDVKKRWGHGQEDIYPVTQFEKLWGDMTALPECANVFAAVSRIRGQQLKDQAQLDGWQRDGSADAIAALCDFE